MTTILGINAYHGDSSACVIKDGKLVAAAEEERFNRIKHWAGFPVEAIKYCLESAGIEIDEIDEIAINHNPKSNYWRKVVFILFGSANLKFISSKLILQKKKKSILDDFKLAFPEKQIKATIVYIDHHQAHLASTFLASPYSRAVLLSIDGFGDFCSTAWGLGQDTKIQIEDQIYFPHSLGIFYQAITQYLGFPNYGDEYKVMGLASYGKPKFEREMGEILKILSNGKFELNLNYFLHHNTNIEYTWKDCSPTVGRLFSSELIKLLGPVRELGDDVTQRHMDIAASAQKIYETALFNLINHLHNKYQLECLALAGGCAMNSVANGKIYLNTPFKKVYLQPSSGDAGGAFGAAVTVAVRNGFARIPMSHAYWGPAYTDGEIEQVIAGYSEEIRSNGCKSYFLNEENLYKEIAQKISNGNIVGWFQGAMEWGPRALGNRSILADPRSSNIRQILNEKIKRRESFRPFAPSVLSEDFRNWFSIDDDVPFMGQVSKVNEDKKQLIPAVTHVDGTGRLQTVDKLANPRFYNLINAFKSITNIPMLLNTSFNENEPIVCKPEQAINCFLRTKMDVLVIGNWVVTR